MPLTNSDVVEQLVQRALVKNPHINMTGISGDDGGGSQPYGFAARQLLIARKGKEEISTQKLSSIAQRLGELLGEELSVEDLVSTQKEAEAEVFPQGGKTMIAKSKKNAPAVNAEQGASVSININTSPKD